MRNNSSVSHNSCSSGRSCIKPVEQDNKNDYNQTSVITVTVGCNFSNDEEVTMKALPGSSNPIIPLDRKHRRTFSWDQCRKKKRPKVAEFATVSTGELCDDKFILPSEHHCNMKLTLKEVPFCIFLPCGKIVFSTG